MRDRAKKKRFIIWKHWMKAGERTGCHQMPERSLYINNYQFPVCARCTGVIIGYLLAIPINLKWGFQKKFSFFGAIVMFTDWFLQKVGVKKSTNPRRVISGVIGGFGLMSMYIKGIAYLCKKFTSYYK